MKKYLAFMLCALSFSALSKALINQPTPTDKVDSGETYLSTEPKPGKEIEELVVTPDVANFDIVYDNVKIDSIEANNDNNVVMFHVTSSSSDTNTKEIYTNCDNLIGTTNSLISGIIEKGLDNNKLIYISFIRDRSMPAVPADGLTSVQKKSKRICTVIGARYGTH